MDFSPSSPGKGLFLGTFLFHLLIGRKEDFVWEKSLFSGIFLGIFGHPVGGVGG
jgi:hypothetical protein